ncbi:hypothetical protein SAMD00019534_003650 [Acytostelium subglobosum LB1]|uniref:hypothetical protein n=1 Tax=Acytostelium subglobosum LB1 TaxID=1410327 RepID=UPI000644CBAE|nr:hypothetical protein SAMD00019534_003650 [Acytostelium subglobosum LB1]GAM17190.1 hypothetical protein SAMD00019534_003650 [Acytostelium subglobosum LB1]|eukprot:XP_012759252.1 hypothetical protein SAMD00019534_003650 [Acytostelium subglobosum LB1]
MKKEKKKKQTSTTTTTAATTKKAKIDTKKKPTGKTTPIPPNKNNNNIIKPVATKPPPIDWTQYLFSAKQQHKEQHQPAKSLTSLSISPTSIPSSASSTASSLVASSIKTTNKGLTTTAVSLSRKKIGFTREVPKKKKPSKLKRNILLYRSLKSSYLASKTEQEQQLALRHQSLTLQQQLDQQNHTEAEHFVRSLIHQIVDNIDNDNGNGNDNGTTTTQQQQSKTQIELPQDYINQTCTPEIDEVAREFIKKIKLLQDNYAANNPGADMKRKRRYITGMREIQRAAECGTLACVIFAPNIEDVGCPGGLNESIQHTIRQCRSNQALYTFALSRRIIGRLLNVQIKVSAFGVLLIDGADELYRRLKELTEAMRHQFRRQQAGFKEENASLIEATKQEAKEINTMFVKNTREKAKKHKELLKEHQELKEERLEREQKEKKERERILRQERALQQEENEHRPVLSQQQKKPKQQQQQPPQQQKTKDKMIEKDDPSEQLMYSNMIDSDAIGGKPKDGGGGGGGASKKSGKGGKQKK